MENLMQFLELRAILITLDGSRKDRALGDVLISQTATVTTKLLPAMADTFCVP